MLTPRGVSKPRLLIATSNLGKLREYRKLLAPIPYKLTSLSELKIKHEVDEVGTSFEDNASIKATTYSCMSTLISLADDSGLEVDALRGEPGIRSKRYAGPGASDSQRIQFLLDRLEGVPYWDRTARFRCVIAVAWPSGRLELCQGSCEGMIAMVPTGSGGFGYDQAFHIPELGKTMAEISIEDKNRISHRAAAARQVIQLLQKNATLL